MSDLPSIPRAVARKLGNYVYIYVDPRTGKPFYVGKGRGARAVVHARSTDRKKLTSMIRGIRAAGLEPRIEILHDSLPTGRDALRMEAAVIDALRHETLANRVRGHGAVDHGRKSLNEAIARYSGKRVEIREPAVLIRINRLYRDNMTPVELYDSTRSAWVISSQPERRKKIRFALAVFEGVVREVYEITDWFRAGSTFNTRWDGHRFRRTRRWEFVGTLAPHNIRKRYQNAYVGDHFKPGNANPIPTSTLIDYRLLLLLSRC